MTMGQKYSTRLKNGDWRGETISRDVSTAHPGQILVMFAFLLVAMLGAVGLAVDLGVAFSQRRTMQSAADAGALAGARVVSKSSTANPLSAQSEVIAMVTANQMSMGTITSLTCQYVNDDGGELGDCAAIVPAGATGVRV